jgi:hypothetical protein
MSVFEVLINEVFVNIDINNLDIVDNKHVFSLINDFESGKWRQDKFQEYIWNNIAETALSKEERKNLVEEPASILKKSAKNLRISEDSGKGSELCEIGILIFGFILSSEFSPFKVNLICLTNSPSKPIWSISETDVMILFSFLIWSSFLKKASTESTALVMAVSILR